MSSAIVMLNDDGTVRLLVGSADIGQGSETMLCQIVAETLGAAYEDIEIKAADTLLTPYAVSYTHLDVYKRQDFC